MEKKTFYFYYLKRKFEHTSAFLGASFAWITPKIPENGLYKVLHSEDIDSEKIGVLFISDFPLDPLSSIHPSTLTRPTWLGNNIKETKIKIKEPDMTLLKSYLYKLVIKGYVEDVSEGCWKGWAGEIYSWYEMFGKFWEK